MKDELKIVGIRKSELEERLATSFKSVLGRGYFYMDCGGRHMPWKNIYDKILSAFEDSKRETIEEAVAQKMSLPGIHRIMDQGCGHAQSLRETTLTFVRKYPDNEFLGYGITGCLGDVWLGGKVFDFQETPEQRKSVKEYGIHSFQERGRNYQFFGIENDIHTIMKKFPYEVDLIFSDNTYFHLVAPWLALKRTVDKLNVGGVAMVRTLFNAKVHTFSYQEIDEEDIVNNLRQDNPHYEILSPTPGMDHRVLTIIKRGEAPFKTHQYLAGVEQKSFDDTRYINARNFYSPTLLRSPFLPIDTL
ncbi:MAG: hypothetical protein Q7K45_01180 [Nanoarchaeota archaeon]|nr:hypothetical protein [Nanoarchaeota archaeon]